jgi:hypothetical protein
MRIVVNHLTRMQRGFICVAGIEPASLKHIRPVLAGRLTTGLLARNSGPFDLGRVIDLGRVSYSGVAPETEDYRFEPHRIRYLQSFSAAQFWELLQRVSATSLPAIFGPDLSQRGPANCVVEAGKGRASLGCLALSARPFLYTRDRQDKPTQVRMKVSDGTFELDLGVTDIRLYDDDYVTPNSKLVEQVTRKLQTDTRTILSVGLTRPFAPSPDMAPVHWLQVNNIHFQEASIWQLG